MGDLASPILVVMGDEARSYVCFCGLMRRVDKNFMTDGIAMTTKFKHLALLLEYHDPVFSQYLKVRERERESESQREREPEREKSFFRSAL